MLFLIDFIQLICINLNFINTVYEIINKQFLINIVILYRTLGGDMFLCRVYIHTPYNVLSSINHNLC